MDRCFSSRDASVYETAALKKLLSVACLFIGSKLHDTPPVGVRELSILTGNLYSPTDIVQMEREVLKMEHLLNHYVHVAPPVQVMEHLLALARLERQPCGLLLHRARKLLNAGLADFSLVKFSAPCMALAATLNAAATHGMCTDDLLRRIAGVDLKVQHGAVELDACRVALQAALDAMATAGETQLIDTPSPTSVAAVAVPVVEAAHTADDRAPSCVQSMDFGEIPLAEG